MINIIRHVTNGTTFYLLNKETFFVGRKESDFLIQDDQSISRRHAKITRKNKNITITDLGSKYKTFCNKDELEKGAEVTLMPGDEIHFGVMNSLFKYEEHKIVTSGTRLNRFMKEQVKDAVTALGGQYSENWHDGCSHLTVHEITLTIKILQALIDKKPIVKPSYWTDFLKNTKVYQDIPDVRNYIPPMAEALLNKIELQQELDRSQIFIGKMFIFSTEQHKKSLEDVIRKAGGVSYSWEKKPMSVKDILNSPKEILIIQSFDQYDDPTFNEFMDILKEKGKRPIAQQEVAVAVVLGNCQKNCNPNYDRTAEVFRNDEHNIQTQLSLVSNTQSEYFGLEISKTQEKTCIPDTFENNLSSQVKNRSPINHLTETTVEKHNQWKRPYQEISQEMEENAVKEAFCKKIRTERNIPKSDKKLDNECFLLKPPTTKRKADTDLGKITKSSENSNPFASLKKFKADSTTKTTKVDNPFAGLFKQNIISANTTTTQNVFKTTCSEEPTDVKSESDNSKLSTKYYQNEDYSTIPSSNSNKEWTRKKPGYITENKIECVDLDMQTVTELLHGTIVAGVLPNHSFRQVPIFNGTNNSTTNTNFKKFSKQFMVKTRTPYKASLVPVNPDNSIDIVDTRKAFDDFEKDDIAMNHPCKTTAPRKFNIQ